MLLTWGRTRRAARGRAPSPEADAWLRDWLRRFRFERSGAPIERYADAIAETLSPGSVAAMRAAAERGDDAGAARILLDAPEVGALKARARLSIARLEAILRAIERGFPTPEASGRAYEPVAGRVLYLLHMRRPFEANGYVTRSETTMRAMEAAGLEPEPSTRLGFPADLSRHRGATIFAEEVCEGRLYRALSDGKGGQVDRPIDDYIHAYAARVVELARARRPAVIYAASNHMNGLAGILAARALGVPCVYEMRGLWHVTQASLDPAFEKTLRFRLQERLEIEAARRADHVVAISEPLRDWAIAQGVPAERVTVAANAVDPGRFPERGRDEALARALDIPDDAVVIGYLGSVTRYEGLDLVLRAFAACPEAVRRRAIVLVVGEGAALAELKALADELGVAGRCRFPGRLPPERASDVYSLIDVAPFARRSLRVTELIPPLKPFEAMAAGRAIIVSDVRAMAGVVEHGRSGLVVAKDEVAALGAALERLIGDPDLRAALGAAAKASIEGRHDLGAMAQAIGRAFAALGAAGGLEEPTGQSWLDEAIGLVAKSGGAGSLSRLAADFAGAGVGDRTLRRGLGSAARRAREQGFAKAAATIAALGRSCSDDARDVAALVGRSTAALVAAGAGGELLSFLARLCASPVDDAVAMAALDGAGREAGRLSDQELQAAILSIGLERFGGAESYAWRVARAAHRAGDYALARRLAPGGAPPDRRALEMTRDFSELDRLPDAVLELTGRPRDHAGAAGREAILYVAFSAFPEATGGYATRTHGLASALLASGASLEVLVRTASAKGGRASPVEWRHDVEGVTYLHPRGEVASGRFMRCRQFGETLRQAIATRSPAIVHAASNFEIGLPAMMAAAKAGLPSVYEVRGFWEITRASERPDFLRAPLFRRNLCAEVATCLLADRVVTLNASMKTFLADCGVPEEAIDLVPNAAPTAVFSPRPKSPEISARLGVAPGDVVLGYVGSFLPYEGIELLVEAFDALAGSIANLKLVLVGDHEPAGPRRSDYFDRIVSLVRSSPHAGRIVLHPRVAYHEVPEIYSVIDIAPFPRRSMLVTEMISPMKPREAMAMGKAVAVANVGGLTSLVEDGVTGLCFAPGDAGALAACLERLVRDEDLRRALARRGLEDVTANGSWEVAVRAVLETHRAATAESRFRDPALWRESGRRAARLLRVDADPEAAAPILAAVEARMRSGGR